MSWTMTKTAHLVVERPQTAAVLLFTPEGERAWSAGWDPAYPDEGRKDVPGTVFTTSHGDQITTWVMVERSDSCVRYARVTHGFTAGTITVETVSCESARTRLSITYDLTALNEEGAKWLGEFARGFDDYIAHWEAAIAAVSDAGG